MHIWLCRPGRLGKVRATCLQAQYTDNQQSFKNSKEAEFFAASYLVLSRFFGNFKITS